MTKEKRREIKGWEENDIILQIITPQLYPLYGAAQASAVQEHINLCHHQDWHPLREKREKGRGIGEQESI